jgi:two-component system, NtrC family, sensor kinase
MSELRQVISNLIGNAKEAMGAAGGRLIVSARTSRGLAGWRRSGVRITVSDTGPGIPVGARSRMFEPMFTTKGEQGTGLGLWVSRKIVERHGGVIRVRSKVGSGTVFQVFIPRPEDGDSPRTVGAK